MTSESLSLYLHIFTMLSCDACIVIMLWILKRVKSSDYLFKAPTKKNFKEDYKEPSRSMQFQTLHQFNHWCCWYHSDRKENKGTSSNMRDSLQILNRMTPNLNIVTNDLSNVFHCRNMRRELSSGWRACQWWDEGGTHVGGKHSETCWKWAKMRGRRASMD